MSDSLISNEKVCFVCATPINLHRHHIFYGVGNRKQSEKWGCWVYLCAGHHDLSGDGVHSNTPFRVTLQKYCQEKWEAKNGSREDFRAVFGKSFI